MYCRKWDSQHKAKIRKLEADKGKKNEFNPSFLLKFEDLKEQVKFLENEKLLLKEQLCHCQEKLCHNFLKKKKKNYKKVFCII